MGHLALPRLYPFFSNDFAGWKFNGKQVLSKESIFEMEQDYTKNARISYSPNRHMGYGLGEWIMEDDKPKAGAVTSPGLFGKFPLGG